MSNPIEHRRGMFNRPEFDELVDGYNQIVSPLTKDVTYHVSPTGNDNNDGLSAATPLKTINAALKKLPKTISADVTIQLAPGKYSEYVSDSRDFVRDPNTLKGSLGIVGSYKDYVPTAGPATGTFAASFGTQRILNTGVVTGATWVVDELKGKFVRVLSGARAGFSLPIASNTADTLTLGMAIGQGTYDLRNAQFKFVEPEVTWEHPETVNGTRFLISLSGSVSARTSGSTSNVLGRPVGYYFSGINFTTIAQNNIIDVLGTTLRLQGCSLLQTGTITSSLVTTTIRAETSAYLYAFACFFSSPIVPGSNRLYAIEIDYNSNSSTIASVINNHYTGIVAFRYSVVSLAQTLHQNQAGPSVSISNSTLFATFSPCIRNSVTGLSVNTTIDSSLSISDTNGKMSIIDCDVGISIRGFVPSLGASGNSSATVNIDGCGDGVIVGTQQSIMSIYGNKLNITNSTRWGVKFAPAFSGALPPLTSGFVYQSSSITMTGNALGDFTLDGTTPISLANVEAAPNKLITDSFGNYIRGI